MNDRREGQIIDDDEGLRRIMETTHRLAVIGIKRSGAASSVPAYMARNGYEVVGVNPSIEAGPNEEFYDTVDEVDGDVDMVVIFRAPAHIPAHVDEILAMSPLPKAVWMQLGIRHERAARRLIEHGIDVVQSRCLLVEHGRLRP